MPALSSKKPKQVCCISLGNDSQVFGAIDPLLNAHAVLLFKGKKFWEIELVTDGSKLAQDDFVRNEKSAGKTAGGLLWIHGFSRFYHKMSKLVSEIRALTVARKSSLNDN